MSEYYAEHESIEELGHRVDGSSSELDDSSAEISASAKVIARSQTLDSLGYSNLASKTQASVSRLSGKVKQISNILNTVSSLYEDYEGRVVAALDDSVSAGNNFTPDSRYETRDVDDKYIERTQDKPGISIVKDRDGRVYVYDYNILKPSAELTPKQKREWTLDWLEKNRPEVLEKIYDRLNNGDYQAVGTIAGTVAGAAAATHMVSGSGSTGTLPGGSYPDSASRTDVSGTTDMPNTGSMDAGISGVGESAAGSGDVPGASDGMGGGSTWDGGTGASSDWVADMLNDAVDSGPIQQAQDAVQQIAGASNPEATRSGAAILNDSASMGFVTDGQNGFTAFWANVGDGVVAVVQKYGINAGLLAGGTGAAYAASGIAVEAVAHCAEFMATKCMPGINGFMEQAAGVIRVTQVNISSIMGGVTRGMGGLVG